MANISFIYFLTLYLVVTIIYLYKVDGKDVTGIRRARECPICSETAKKLLPSPWYAVPRRSARRRHASRSYRDTSNQESRELDLEDKREKDKSTNTKIDLTEEIFGAVNVDEKNNHERKERSSVQEFEFEGKKYAIVYNNGHSEIEEAEPEVSSSIISSITSPRNIERLFSIYESVEKFVKLMDPKKTIYENLEQVIFDIFRTIIQEQFPKLLDNHGQSQVAQRTENRAYGIHNEGQKPAGYTDRTIYANPPRPGRSESNGFSSSEIGKGILQELITRKSEDSQSAKSSLFNREPRYIGAESVVTPRYEIPSTMISDLYTDFSNRDFQPTTQHSRPTDRPSPAEIIKNVEQESSIFSNRRNQPSLILPENYYLSPASIASAMELGDTDVNHDFYNRRRVIQHPNEVPAWTYKREIERNDRTPTPLEYVTLEEPFDTDKDDSSVRLTRSERPPKEVENFEQPEEPAEVPEYFGNSGESKNSENFSITDESGTLANSGNSTNVSESDETIRDRVAEVFEELFKPEGSRVSSTETADTASILLDKLRNIQRVVNAGRNETSVSSQIEKAPSIGSG